MVDFKTSSSKFEVTKSNSWKITSFSKTMALQREPFLTMFYTINLSPLLITKKGFMRIIILCNYQWCPLPLSLVHTSCEWNAKKILTSQGCFRRECLAGCEYKSTDANYLLQIFDVKIVARSMNQALRTSPPAGITKMIMTMAQRECILLVEWACAYSAWIKSTNTMCSICAEIIIVFAIAAVWLCL